MDKDKGVNFSTAMLMWIAGLVLAAFSLAYAVGDWHGNNNGIANENHIHIIALESNYNQLKVQIDSMVNVVQDQRVLLSQASQSARQFESLSAIIQDGGKSLNSIKDDLSHLREQVGILSTKVDLFSAQVDALRGIVSSAIEPSKRPTVQ